MDDFIRRQYTYRRVYPNPMLKIERVWKELFNGDGFDLNDNDGSELGDIEEVDEQTIISWLELTVSQRLDILHNLCEWQLLSDKFRERVGATNDLQMSSWRIEPVGSDSKNRLYYFLDDGRLYRSSNPATSYERMSKKMLASSRKRKREFDAINPAITRDYRGDWACIASSYDQWHAIVDGLSSKSTSEERQLLDYLRHEALPYIEQIEAERHAKEAALKAKAEKAEAERIKEMLRLEALSTRKRSSRIAVLDEKREAERLRLEEIDRQREMEARARHEAQLEQAEQGLNIRKTREARARDRELRDYLNGRPFSTATLTDPEESAATAVSVQDKPVVIEEAREHEPLMDKIYEVPEEAAQFDGQTGYNLQPAITLSEDHQDDSNTAVNRDNVLSSENPNEKLDDETIQVSTADRNWVHNKALEMTDQTQKAGEPPHSTSPTLVTISNG